MECLDYLTWSLEGKALDYITHAMKSEKFTYKTMMKKLEGRFGSYEMTDTARMKFTQATQNVGEGLDTWSDRVRTLSTYAFPGWESKLVNKEQVTKFCQGALDKEAGRHTILKHPKSVDEAETIFKEYQCYSLPCEGKKKRESINVNEMKLDDAPSSQDMMKMQKKINMLQSQLQSVTSQLNKSKNTNSKHQVRRNTNFKPNYKPPTENEDSIIGPKCFFCSQQGHFKVDCPRYKRWLANKESKTKEVLGGDLNKDGPGETA